MRRAQGQVTIYVILGLTVILLVSIGLFAAGNRSSSRLPPPVVTLSETWRPSLALSPLEEAIMLTAELREESQQDEPDSDLMESWAERRSELLPLLLVQDALALIYSANELRAFPPDLADVLEQETGVSGSLVVLAASRSLDSHEHEEELMYRIVTPDATYDLKTILQPAPTASGADINVSGYLIGGTILSTGFPSHLQIDYKPFEPVIGPYRVLVVLVTFPGREHPKPREEIEEMVFRGRAQRFIQEDSYGEAWLDGDVLEWVVVESTGGACPPPTQYTRYPHLQLDAHVPEIGAAILQHPVDLSHYDTITYVIDGCGGGGLGVVGKGNFLISNQFYRISKSWVGLYEYGDYLHGSLYDRSQALTHHEFVLVHELGHNFGLRHANALGHGGDHPLAEPTRTIEYGNHFDVMGVGSYGLHMNAWSKVQLGWLSDLDALVVHEPGTYEIGRLMAPGSPKFAVILDEMGSPRFFLESRKAEGFDHAVSRWNPDGLLVYLPPESGFVGHRSTLLLDMGALSPDRLVEEMMTFTPGVTFTAPIFGLTLKDVAQTMDGFSFGVDYQPPVCVRRLPFFTPLPSPLIPISLAAGSVVYFSAWLVSNDAYSCPLERFRVVMDLPEGFERSADKEGAILLGPGDGGELAFAVKALSDTQPGLYSLGFALERETGERIEMGMVTFEVEGCKQDEVFCPSAASGFDLLICRNGSFTADWCDERAPQYESTVCDGRTAYCYHLTEPDGSIFQNPWSITYVVPNCGGVCQRADYPSSYGWGPSYCVYPGTAAPWRFLEEMSLEERQSCGLEPDTGSVECSAGETTCIDGRFHGCSDGRWSQEWCGKDAPHHSSTGCPRQPNVCIGVTLAGSDLRNWSVHLAQPACSLYDIATYPDSYTDFPDMAACCVDPSSSNPWKFLFELSVEQRAACGLE